MDKNPAAHDVEDLKAADAKDMHRAVREEGEDELDRPAWSLFWSGLAAGIAITASLIAESAIYQALPDAPWRMLVASLGYPIGFLIVILGRMQFFTESTITAMLPLVTKPSLWALRRTMRLWIVVLAANMLGVFLAAGMIALGWLGDEALRAAMITLSERVLEHDAGATFVNAIPAGFLIAIIAWLLSNAREQGFLVIFAITYVVSIAGFSHSIVGSDEAFLLLFTGKTGVAQTVFALVLPAVAGNLLGGAGLFALLAHGQVRGEMTRREE